MRAQLPLNILFADRGCGRGPISHAVVVPKSSSASTIWTGFGGVIRHTGEIAVAVAEPIRHVERVGQPVRMAAGGHAVNRDRVRSADPKGRSARLNSKWFHRLALCHRSKPPCQALPPSAEAVLSSSRHTPRSNAHHGPALNASRHGPTGGDTAEPNFPADSAEYRKGPQTGHRPDEC